MRISYIILVLIGVVFSSCNREYAAKPKAYPRVIYPEKKYVEFAPAGCPFTCQIPQYAIAEKDTNFISQKVDTRCWTNILFPNFNGTINLTYKELNGEETLAKLLEDAHTLTYKHTKKANFIDEYQIKNSHGVDGMIYDVGGDAASNFQFYLTDKKKHYIRGALYFYNEPNTDSMKPVIQFVRKDLDYMIETFQWK